MHQESALEVHPAAVVGDGTVNYNRTASWRLPSGINLAVPDNILPAYAHVSFLVCIRSVVFNLWPPPHWLM